MQKKSTIGVWGLGVSGQSMITYFLAQGHPANVLDKTVPTADVQQFFATKNITFYHDPAERAAFFDVNDTIVASPGIDLSQLTAAQQAKCVSELDIFYNAWQRKIIAITGTLGKTSITHLLTALLKSTDVEAIAGGNIGTGMLDLTQHTTATTAVLELSSFQLEHARTFAPDLAIITNIYPNHLDRHGTIEAYAAAKKKIFVHQGPDQLTLLPLSCLQYTTEERARGKQFFWFSSTPPSAKERDLIGTDALFYITANGAIVYENNNTTHHLIPASEVPPFSFKENWLIIAAALYLLGFDAQKIIRHSATLALPHNRLEPVATVNGVTYYNDSKATIMQATIAALNALLPRPVILLLGGTSKGVDRTAFLHQLQSAKLVICFGGEAEQLAAGCAKNSVATHACATLEEAFACANEKAKIGDCVVLSPGGASFDLFKNYEERGERFVALVQAMAAKK